MSRILRIYQVSSANFQVSLKMFKFILHQPPFIHGPTYPTLIQLDVKKMLTSGKKIRAKYSKADIFLILGTI